MFVPEFDAAATGLRLGADAVAKAGEHVTAVREQLNRRQ